MSYKIVGVVCIVSSCFGVGWKIASQYLRQIRLLRQISSILEYMEYELQYRCLALPQLCRQASEQGTGTVYKLMALLAKELEAQIRPNAQLCMESALEKVQDLPHSIHQLCRNLGASLGKFDLDGQVKGLISLRKQCNQLLDELQRTKDTRIRSYRTLGLCAGAALAILFA